MKKIHADGSVLETDLILFQENRKIMTIMTNSRDCIMNCVVCALGKVNVNLLEFLYCFEEKADRIA